jgi:alpha-L-rhamnosidase
VARVPAPGWADVPIILTWTAWWRYGDSAIIEQNWEAMDRHLQFVLDHNPNGIWRNKRSDFGDWLAVDWDKAETPVTSYELIGTAYWAHSTQLLAAMGEAIGRHERAAALRRLHSLIRQAFVSMFVRDDGSVGNETQTSYVLALKFGLLPDDLRPKAAAQLVADIRRRGGALSTGFLGTQYILDVLADSGYAEVALDLLLRTEYPSWGYMIARGGTTMWESWNEKIKSGSREGIIRNSYNHCPLGAVSGFLFRRVAGIDAAAPGFASIVIRPLLDHRIAQGGGDYDSVMGRISTRWTRNENGALALDVTAPVNTTARVHLPAGRNSRIAEGGIDVALRDDMRLINRADAGAVIEIGSGTYRFVVSQPDT